MKGKQSRHQNERQSDSERRRRAVLKAASQCFAQQGYKKTSVAEIARQAGVSKGLVFHFFDSKQKLFSIVFEDGIEQWSMLESYRVSEGKDNSLSELRQIFMAAFDFMEQYPVPALVAYDEEIDFLGYKEELEKKNIAWRKRIKKIIARGIENGEIRKEIDIGRITAIYHILQRGLIRQSYKKKEANARFRETVELAVEVFIKGIEN